MKLLPLILPLVISIPFLIGCQPAVKNQKKVIEEKENEMLSIAKEVASQFNYYDEISFSTPNYLQGKNEINGQCSDYALSFVNKWNIKYPNEALLVIQQQGLEEFPDGIYEVVEKDTQELPFLQNRKTSMLYKWNNKLGIGHPVLGGYTIRLIQKANAVSHFNLENWDKNGPHVWVKIGNLSIDPTYADFGTLPIIGTDKFLFQ